MSGLSAATIWCKARSTARSDWHCRKAPCSISTQQRHDRALKKSICANAACALERRRRTLISARSSAMLWFSQPVQLAPARPGSRSPTLRNYSSARRSTASSCRGRQSRPVNVSGSCPVTCAKDEPSFCPLYDALYDLWYARIVERALQTGEIEIAPLAFMRGRTLPNAAVILDEAQNTTAMQMKMLLTRL